jgi:hypothetical protein
MTRQGRKRWRGRKRNPAGGRGNRESYETAGRREGVRVGEGDNGVREGRWFEGERGCVIMKGVRGEGRETAGRSRRNEQGEL